MKYDMNTNIDIEHIQIHFCLKRFATSIINDSSSVVPRRFQFCTIIYKKIYKYKYKKDDYQNPESIGASPPLPCLLKLCFRIL